jgi:uncharacterized protein YkwD
MLRHNLGCLFALTLFLSLAMSSPAPAQSEPTPSQSAGSQSELISGKGTAAGSGAISGNGVVTNNGDGTITIQGTVTVIGSVTVKISDLQGPPKTGAGTLDSEELAFVTLLNALRAQHGLAPLKVSTELNQLSLWMSADMAAKNYFNHNDQTGRNPFNRMTDAGYHAEFEGENIAAGNSDAQGTYIQWLNSPGHLKNMLDPNYTELGVGRAYDANSEYHWYWTTDFGSN